MSNAPRQRTFASGLKFRLGLVGFEADAVSIRRTNSTKDVSFVNICPDCGVSLKGGQRFVCEANHGPFLPSELKKARETEEGLVPMTDEDIAAVAGDFVEGLMELSICPRSELEANTRPGETAYRLRPDKKGQGASGYAILREMARHPELAIVGAMKLNGRMSPAPYTLEVWGDQLVLQGLVRPQDLAERDEIDATPDERLVGMAMELMEANAKAFDAAALADERIGRLAVVLATKGGGVEPEATVTPIAKDDLFAALAASLEKGAA